VSDLELVGVHKGYSTQPVLTGVDLHVASDSLTAVLGSSGSGKTTLLRLVAGFDRIDQGEIRIGGRTVDDSRAHEPPERRRLGYVPQEGALFPHLTVGANVGFGLSRAERRGARVDELLELVGLAGLQRRYPDQLSGGQQQRVALARALAVQPSLVLLDEPFSSLDATLRASLRIEVREILRHAGATAVLVTHDQDEALSLADRVAVLRAGQIVQHAAPHDLYTDPVDAELARFLGDVNVFDTILGGELADTPLGPVRLAQRFAQSGPGQVMLRPEQVTLHRVLDEGRTQGRVRGADYHGHYTIVRVALEVSGIEVVVRHEDLEPLAPDSAVSLSVDGAAKAWPAPST
jgi:iron(III) transport system ATP-binding protein